MKKFISIFLFLTITSSLASALELIADTAAEQLSQSYRQGKLPVLNKEFFGIYSGRCFSKTVLPNTARPVMLVVKNNANTDAQLGPLFAGIKEKTIITTRLVHPQIVEPGDYFDVYRKDLMGEFWAAKTTRKAQVTKTGIRALDNDHWQTPLYEVRAYQDYLLVELDGGDRLCYFFNKVDPNSAE